MSVRLYFWAILIPCLAAAQSTRAVDRGAASQNLNDNAGVARSNVRWTWYEHGFIGDDFTIGEPGERWVIDAIRTWTVPGELSSPQNLGDLYQDVRLYFGDTSGDLTPIVSGRLAKGTSQPDNAAITVSDAAANGVLKYENFGHLLKVWQVDFKTSGLVVDGGVKYRFGVWGQGRSEARGRTYPWFNLASNSGLGGSAAQGADDTLLMFDSAGAYEGTLDANGAGWNKPADINVQIFAHKVSQ